MKTDELPENKTEASILRMKAAHYVIYNDKLYIRGYSMSLLKSVTPSEVYYIMRETHEGICKIHAKGQSLVFKALKHGYYWRIMKSDCMEFARKCNKC